GLPPRAVRGDPVEPPSRRSSAAVLAHATVRADDHRAALALRTGGACGGTQPRRSLRGADAAAPRMGTGRAAARRPAGGGAMALAAPRRRVEGAPVPHAAA